MSIHAVIGRLVGMPAALRSLAVGVSSEDAHFKPPSGAWSIVEIMNHLVDEERDDFRSRLRSTLESPEKRWPPNDPEAWSRDRRYQERDLSESLTTFEKERAESIRWLRSLGTVDWEQTHIHPKAGPVRAGDLLVSWAAHDALHMRQIAKRLYELAGRDGAEGGFSTRYAGEWGI